MEYKIKKEAKEFCYEKEKEIKVYGIYKEENKLSEKEEYITALTIVISITIILISVIAEKNMISLIATIILLTTGIRFKIRECKKGKPTWTKQKREFKTLQGAKNYIKWKQKEDKKYE